MRSIYFLVYFFFSGVDLARESSLPIVTMGVSVDHSTVLLVAMFSFSGFAVAEVVGASIANSKSLMADAATMVRCTVFAK